MRSYPIRKLCSFLLVLLLVAGSSAAQTSKTNHSVTYSTNQDHLPRETFVPFTRKGNLLLVDGAINGKRTTMIFDTGAAGCLFSIATLRSLGIQIPPGLKSSSVAGVGSKEGTQAWIMPVNLSLGSIERYHFPVAISNSPINLPLMGVSFLKGFEYTVNTDDNIIQFKRIDSDLASAGTIGAAATGQKPASNEELNEMVKRLTSKPYITVDKNCRYVYTVPFFEYNGAIIVMVKIEGRDCPMILDTGTNICLFNNRFVRELGIMPHSTGKEMLAKGATGFIKAPLCTYSYAEFGPIKQPIVFLLSDQAFIPRPLLGQNFFNKWELTIDHTNKVVKFIRK